MKKQKVMVTLTGKNWQRLRILALNQNTSGSAIIDKLIASYLKRKGGR